MVKKMTPIERAKALMMLGMGVSIREVARKMGRSKGAIHKFKEKATQTPLFPFTQKADLFLKEKLKKLQKT